MPLSKIELDTIINNYINRLSRDIPVEKAYLFGSYAYGTPTQASNIDLAIISPVFSGRRNIDNMKLLSKIAAKCNSMIEALPYTMEETGNPDKRSLLFHIIKNGIEYPTQKKVFIESDIKQTLCNFAEISICMLYGSALNGRLTQESDIDIAVAGEKPLNYEQRLTIIAALEKVLAQKVDLVDLNQVAGLIKKEILTKGKLLLCKNNAQYALLLKEVWYFEADWLPQLRSIMQARSMRFAYGN